MNVFDFENLFGFMHKGDPVEFNFIVRCNFRRVMDRVYRMQFFEQHMYIKEPKVL